MIKKRESILFTILGYELAELASKSFGVLGRLSGKVCDSSTLKNGSGNATVVHEGANARERRRRWRELLKAHFTSRVNRPLIIVWRMRGMPLQLSSQ